MSNKSTFIDFMDTTLRDGQQSPMLFDTHKYRFNLEDKISIVNGLLALGVRHFELFSPVVSKLEEEDSLSLMEVSRRKCKSVKFIAHCRLHEKDIAKAIESGFDGINLYIGTSTQAKTSSHKMSTIEIISRAKSILSKVREDHPDLYIRFSAEDAFRTEIEEIFEIYDAVAPYVNTFGAPDTVGVATPGAVRRVIRSIHKRYPKHSLECHFHNDRGLAIANTIEAVSSGVSYVDSSIWGLAERSGIPSVTAVLFNMVKDDHTINNKYDISQAYPVNVLMGAILKTHVPYSEPISLTNRTHTAGVHQKAVLGSKEVYEAHELDKFGVNQNQLLLGPLSGWNLIFYYLREIGNYELTQEQAKEVSAIFKNSPGKLSKKHRPESILFKISDEYGLIRRQLPKNLSEKRIETI